MGLLLGMVEARSVNVKKTTTTTLLFVCFQVNNGVLYYLDYVEDIYIRALSVLVSILKAVVKFDHPRIPAFQPFMKPVSYFLRKQFHAVQCLYQL